MTKARIWTFILVLIAIHLAAVGCDDGDGDGDTDADLDTESDADVETDGDADGDIDGDADGDMDGDVDGDADMDGDVDGDADGDGDGDMDGDADGDGGDVEPPTVVSVEPADGSLIGGAQTIIVTFSEPADAASLTLGGQLGDEADEPAWEEEETLLFLSPATRWEHGEGRTLTIRVQDLAGNESELFEYTFDVDAEGPAIAEVDPVEGERINGSQTITVTFTEAVDPETVAIGGPMGDEAAAVVLAGGDMAAIIDPTTTWTEGEDRTLTLEAADLLGNGSGELSISFDVDLSGPEVTWVEPDDGTLIGAATAIVVTFSEAVDPATLVPDGDLASEAGEPVWSEGDTLLTLGPETSWTSGEGRTLSVGASDPLGNVGPVHAVSFDVDATGPSVVEVVPEPELRPWTSVTIRFDEDVDDESLELGGDIGEARVESWTSSREVTIVPTTRWTVGLGRELTVRASDAVGNPLAGGSSSHLMNVRFVVAVDTRDNVGTYTSLALSPDGETVYISYYDAISQEVDFIRSDDGGETWSEPVAVDEGNGGNDLSVEGSTILLAYHGNGNGDGFSDLMLATSDDGGETWSEGEVLVPGRRSGDFRMYEGEQTAIARLDTVVVISFVEMVTGPLAYAEWNGRAIVSSDEGASWFEPVNTGCHEVRSGYSTSAALAGVGEEVSVYIAGAYVSRADRFIQFARSLDHGATWEASVPENPEPRVGTHPSVAAVGDGSAETALFLSYANNTGQNLRFARSDDNGETWVIDDIDSDGRVGEFTSLATSSSGESVYIAYHDAGEGALRFLRSDDGGASWPAATIVDDLGSVGQHASLAIVETAGSTIVGIAYYDSGARGLKFARSDDNGETW